MTNNMNTDDRYKSFMCDISKMVYPQIPSQIVNEALDESMRNNYKPVNVMIDNSYSKKSIEKTLKEISDYIYDKEPIITSWGVLFNKHDRGPNLLAGMVGEFCDSRDIDKKKMFKYPKGSDDYNKYFMLQLLHKIDANGTYGAIAQESSLLFNLNSAASITATGQSLISSAIMFFEMILSNNVKFASLNEVMTFIHNILSERDDRKFNIIKPSENITVEQCFYKIINTCGDFRVGENRWIPDFDDMDIILQALCRLSQDDINRIYFKNNLYEFFDLESMDSAIMYIMRTLKDPYINPYDVPEEIKVELDVVLDLVREYVFYNYQIIDKVDRNRGMIKNISLASDTDSSLACLDGWYRYISNKIADEKLQCEKKLEAFSFFDESVNAFDLFEEYEDYDFIMKDIKMVYNDPNAFTVEEDNSVKFSIVNIMAYILSALIDEYMLDLTKSMHSFSIDKKCFIHMKNEFLMETLLMTTHKKNYASKMILQEGKLVPEDEQMDIKGLPIKKSTMNKSVRNELQGILKRDVLDAKDLDQLKVVKSLAILESKIRNSITNGDKEYFKPVSIKALSSYDDPMRMQGIKASVVYNAIKDPDINPIDLTDRNTVFVAKVIITEESIQYLKEESLDVFERVHSVLLDDNIFKPKKSNGKLISMPMKNRSIDAIAIPSDAEVPKWLIPFIDINTIVNDSLKNFPLESIGISRMGNSNISYSNIVSI